MVPTPVLPKNSITVPSSLAAFAKAEPWKTVPRRGIQIDIYGGWTQVVFYEAVEPSCEPGGREEIKATGVNVQGLQNKFNQGGVYYLMKFAVTPVQFMAGRVFYSVFMASRFFTHLKI